MKEFARKVKRGLIPAMFVGGAVAVVGVGSFTAPTTALTSISTDDVFAVAQYVIAPLLGLAAVAVGVKLTPRLVSMLKRAIH